VSYDAKGLRIAFDVCPVNTILNQLAKRIGQEYDHDGLSARSGKVDLLLLEKMNALAYYDQKPPKSLGFEWCNEHIWPLIKKTDLSVPDLLRTMVEHIAFQLSRALDEFERGNLLVTGGGTKNKFLIERFAVFSKHELTVPADLIIDYKEALIFAFLGVLRVRGEVNCLSSVTGATRDSVGGAIYLP
jgi:anhydro-N-acetylmuramic acid kinase